MDGFAMTIKSALALSASLLIIFSCASGDERDFKNIAKHLLKSLSRIEEIKIKQERPKAKTEDQGILYFNYEERNVFIVAKRTEWERLATELKTYLTKYPKSRWADDANFCLVMMYLSISLGGNTYYIEAIREIKSFLKNVPTPRIEDWTKKGFSDMPLFRFILEPERNMPDRLKRELLDFPEDQRIRRVFTWAIISKLLAAGRLSEAREELKTLKQEFPEGKGLAVGLQNMIEIYEQRTDMLRKQGRLRPETK